MEDDSIYFHLFSLPISDKIDQPSDATAPDLSLSQFDGETIGVLYVSSFGVTQIYRPHGNFYSLTFQINYRFIHILNLKRDYPVTYGIIPENVITNFIHCIAVEGRRIDQRSTGHPMSIGLVGSAVISSSAQ